MGNEQYQLLEGMSGLGTNYDSFITRGACMIGDRVDYACIMPLCYGMSPIPSRVEMKLSPSGSGPYFHAQKPPTLKPFPNGSYDQWMDSHRGWKLINPPTMECAGLLTFSKGHPSFSAGSATDGYIAVWWNASGHRPPLNAEWSLLVRSYEWDGSRGEWKCESARCVPGEGCDTLLPNSIEACAQHALISAHTMIAMGRSTGDYRYSMRYHSNHFDSCTVITDDFNFKHNELEVFEEITDLGYWRQSYRSIAGNAYIDAARNLPKTSNNSLQNLVEVINLIRSIKSGNLGKSAVNFVKSNTFSKVKNAWLAYRYSYKTTQMDLQEYKDLYSRLANLRNGGNLVTHGQFSYRGIFARCSFKVPVDSVVPDNLKELLHTSGFYLKAADVWDDIPFSFIVDWFTQFGDVLSHVDDAGQAAEVRPAGVWYSFTTSYDDQITYFRVPGVPIWNVPFLDWNTGTSTNVKAMRIADTISLFT